MLARLADLATSLEEEPHKLGISALKMQRLLGPAPSSSAAVAGQELLAVWIAAQRFKIAFQLGKGERILIRRGCFSETLHALVFRRGFLLLMHRIASTLCFCHAKETFWRNRDPDSDSRVPQEH